jgi:hypothetical protein
MEILMKTKVNSNKPLGLEMAETLGELTCSHKFLRNVACPRDIISYFR